MCWCVSRYSQSPPDISTRDAWVCFLLKRLPSYTVLLTYWMSKLVFVLPCWDYCLSASKISIFWVAIILWIGCQFCSWASQSLRVAYQTAVLPCSLERLCRQCYLASHGGSQWAFEEETPCDTTLWGGIPLEARWNPVAFPIKLVPSCDPYFIGGADSRCFHWLSVIEISRSLQDWYRTLPEVSFSYPQTLYSCPASILQSLFSSIQSSHFALFCFERLRRNGCMQWTSGIRVLSGSFQWRLVPVGDRCQKIVSWHRCNLTKWQRRLLCLLYCALGNYIFVAKFWWADWS